MVNIYPSILNISIISQFYNSEVVKSSINTTNILKWGLYLIYFVEIRAHFKTDDTTCVY